MDARTEDQKQKISWTHALREIVVNCYKFHQREDLLPAFSEEDAAAAAEEEVEGHAPQGQQQEEDGDDDEEEEEDDEEGEDGDVGHDGRGDQRYRTGVAAIGWTFLASSSSSYVQRHIDGRKG
jgi:hypothetical protein